MQVMSATASQVQSDNSWLLEHGPKELELLFRAIVFQPSTPILLADNDRNYREASVGASLLLGVPREKIIGQTLDDFAEPAMKPIIPELWHDFLEQGEQAGALRLLGSDGTPHEVEYMAKSNVLPVRHLLVLRGKTQKTAPAVSSVSVDSAVSDEVPEWVQDFALFLLDPEGQISAWYQGAERIYGYTRSEVAGRDVSFCYPGKDTYSEVRNSLKRAASAGHVGTENWQVKKDGSRFWANIITLALRDDLGALRGFGCVVRDFSDRHERDERLRRNRPRRPPSRQPSSASCRVNSTACPMPTTRFSI